MTSITNSILPQSCPNIKNRPSSNETFPCEAFLNMACSTTLQTCPGALTNLIKSLLTLQASQTPASKLQHRSNPTTSPFHFANHLATSHNNATIVPTLQDELKFGSKGGMSRTYLIGDGGGWSNAIRMARDTEAIWFQPIKFTVSTCQAGKKCVLNTCSSLLKRLRTIPFLHLSYPHYISRSSQTDHTALRKNFENMTKKAKNLDRNFWEKYLRLATLKLLKIGGGEPRQLQSIFSMTSQTG
jgi:hypothetical protein